MLSVLKSIEAINEKRFPELKPDNSFEMCLLSKEIDMKQISKSFSLSLYIDNFMSDKFETLNFNFSRNC
jgi:hypothetical protein